MQLSAGKLWGMRRMADDNGLFKMTAVDQRPPIKGPIAKHHGVAEAPWQEVADFKTLLIETLQGQSSAMLLDPHFAIPRGIGKLSPAKGLIVTLEDSVFEETPDGRLSREINDWSVAKIKRMGGDAVKVLAWYRPDAPEHNRQKQKDFTKRIGEACARHDIPFLFELLVYPLKSDAHQTTDYVEMTGKRTDHVLQSVADFAAPEFGIDVFKLESPVAAKDVPKGKDAQVQAAFDEMGRLAGRPWVMLSAGAGKAEFRNILNHAYRAGASGYLAGRAIWLEPFGLYPDWSGMRKGLETGSVDYMRDLNALGQACGVRAGWSTVRAGGPEFPAQLWRFRLMPASGSVEQQAVDDARRVSGIEARGNDHGFALPRHGAGDGRDQHGMGDHQLVAGAIEFLDGEDQFGRNDIRVGAVDDRVEEWGRLDIGAAKGQLCGLQRAAEFAGIDCTDRHRAGGKPHADASGFLNASVGQALAALAVAEIGSERFSARGAGIAEQNGVSALRQTGPGSLGGSTLCDRGNGKQRHREDEGRWPTSQVQVHDCNLVFLPGDVRGHVDVR